MNEICLPIQDNVGIPTACQFRIGIVYATELISLRDTNFPAFHNPVRDSSSVESVETWCTSPHAVRYASNKTN